MSVKKTANQRSFNKLYQYARRNGMKGVLNSYILKLAKEINENGLKDQIGYLIKNAGISKTTLVVNDLLIEELLVGDMCREMKKNYKLPSLIRVLYDIKLREAHDLAHSRYTQVVRYLINEIGVEKVKSLVTSEGVGEEIL